MEDGGRAADTVDSAAVNNEARSCDSVRTRELITESVDRVRPRDAGADNLCGPRRCLAKLLALIAAKHIEQTFMRGIAAPFLRTTSEQQHS